MKNMITKDEAVKMMKDHSMSAFDLDCFFKQFGDVETYHVQDVRYFLGY